LGGNVRKYPNVQPAGRIVGEVERQVEGVREVVRN